MSLRMSTNSTGEFDVGQSSRNLLLAKPEIDPYAGTPFAWENRRINYYFKNQAGITDRAWVFDTLLKLGAYHNATVNIDGISLGPQAWLSSWHSPRINDDWGHYFDIEATVGKFGAKLFSEKEQEKDTIHCSTFYKPKHRLWPDYADPTLHPCVNIYVDLWEFFFPKATAPYGDDPFFESSIDFLFHAPRLHLSRAVDETTKRILLGPRSYGFIRIRLCDMERFNSVCSQPEKVSAYVSQHPEVKTWFVFWYATQNYKESLQIKLAEVDARPVIAFEDDLAFGDVDRNDNFMTTLVMLNIRAGATARYDTHFCDYDKPDTWSKSPTEKEIDDSRIVWSQEMDANSRAVCR